MNNWKYTPREPNDAMIKVGRDVNGVPLHYDQVREIWTDMHDNAPKRLDTTGCLLPSEMTPAIADALGMMIFDTAPIAHALRIDGQEIPHKVEAEQAHVLFWFLRLAITEGDAWRNTVGIELTRIAKAAGEKRAASR